MMRMFTTAYAESVSCTPIWLMGEPMGPIENGMTYMVRPAIEPLNRLLSFLRITNGSSQLFVGPALSFEERADVGAVFYSCHIVRRTAGVEAAGPLDWVELREGSSGNEFALHLRVFLVGTGEPVDAGGLA